MLFYVNVQLKNIVFEKITVTFESESFIVCLVYVIADLFLLSLNNNLDEFRASFNKIKIKVMAIALVRGFVLKDRDRPNYGE